MRYVVLSSDRNPDYLFPLPMTCGLWRERCGRKPLVFLVGEEQEWLEDPPAAECLAALADPAFGDAEIEFIRPADGYRTATTGQVVRLFAAQRAGLRAEDLLLTADADMWPLSRRYFDRTPEANDLLLYGGDAYAHEPAFKVPICYIEARAATWRNVFGVKEGVGLAAAIQSCLDDGLAREAHGLEAAGAPADEVGQARFREWCFDEVLAGRHVGAAVKLGVCVGKVVQRKPSFWRNNSPGAAVHGRIDRSDWRSPLPADRLATNGDQGLIDAHLDRPGWTERNWGRYLGLLSVAGPGWMTPAAIAYHARFRAALERRS